MIFRNKKLQTPNQKKEKKRETDFKIKSSSPIQVKRKALRICELFCRKSNLFPVFQTFPKHQTHIHWCSIQNVPLFFFPSMGYKRKKNLDAICLLFVWMFLHTLYANNDDNNNDDDDG